MIIFIIHGAVIVIPLQFHRGRRPRRERWVLGLFDTQYALARPYLQLVRRRNAATLLRIFQRKVQPGSIVHRDQWAAYRQLQRRLGLQHGTVNHSLHFVDSVTGVHTQNAESNWCTAKEKFKKMKRNTNPDFLLEYLQEFTWRRWYGEPHPNGCFRRLLDDIAEQYPLEANQSKPLYSYGTQHTARKGRLFLLPSPPHPQSRLGSIPPHRSKSI